MINHSRRQGIKIRENVFDHSCNQNFRKEKHVNISFCVCVSLIILFNISTSLCNHRHLFIYANFQFHCTHAYIYIFIWIHVCIHLYPQYIYIYIYIYIYHVTEKTDWWATKLPSYDNCRFLQDFRYIYIYIYTNPSARAGYDTRSIFKWSLTGLNSEFSFS